MRAFHLLALPALALMISACGSKEQTITVQDGEGKDQTITTENDGDVLTVKSQDGSAVIRTGAEGANFPAYAPQYPGSEVTASANFSGKDDASGSMITQSTTDPTDKVMAFYKAKVTEAGLKIAMESNTAEGGMMMVGSEGAGEQVGMMIAVSKDGDKTMITYTGGIGK
jgi:hypothetical protein